MTEEKIPNLFPIVTSYAIAVSLLYLFGYWSSFDINILEYVSFQDVLKLGIYPVLIGAIVTVSAILPRAILFQDDIKRVEPQKVFFLVNRRFARWSSLIALIAAPFSLVVFHNPERWTVFGLLLSYLAILTIEDVKILSPLIPNFVLRKIVVSAAILLLINSFTTAKISAHSVLFGKNVKLISTQLFKEKGTELFEAKGMLSGQDTLKYIGAAGDYFFFLSMDNKKTYAVKYSDLHYLEFANPNSVIKEQGRVQK